MIYIDTSVALATLFNEERHPPPSLWASPIVSSRLLPYEIHVRLNAVAAPAEAFRLSDAFLQNAELIDLDSPALQRALQPFPVSVRTLDAIHLATMDFLRARGLVLELATYDRRLAAAATAMGFTLASLTERRRR